MTILLYRLSLTDAHMNSDARADTKARAHHASNGMLSRPPAETSHETAPTEYHEGRRMHARNATDARPRARRTIATGAQLPAASEHALDGQFSRKGT